MRDAFTMLRRKPTRVELTQTDIDELDLVRREAELARLRAVDSAAEAATPPPPTRREAAVAGQSANDRLGLSRPTQPADPAAGEVRRA